MGVKYDENTKLWTNSDNGQLNIVDVSNSLWIWEKLLEHGPKIAQVVSYYLIGFIAFTYFFILKKNIIIADQ